MNRYKITLKRYYGEAGKNNHAFGVPIQRRHFQRDRIKETAYLSVYQFIAKITSLFIINKYEQKFKYHDMIYIKRL